MFSLQQALSCRACMQGPSYARHGLSMAVHQCSSHDKALDWRMGPFCHKLL